MPSQVWYVNCYSQPTVETLRLICYVWESSSSADVAGSPDYHVWVPTRIALAIPGLQRQGIDQVVRRLREV